MRLRGVLDHVDASVRDLRERPQVRDLAVEVNWHNGPRPSGHGVGDPLRVDAVVPLADVDDDGNATSLCHSLEGRHERASRDDHLVAPLEPDGQQGEADPVEAARHADAVAAPHVRRERLLEDADVGAVREGIALEQPLETREHLLPDRLVDLRQVEERHGGRGRVWVGDGRETLHE